MGSNPTLSATLGTKMVPTTWLRSGPFVQMSTDRPRTFSGAGVSGTKPTQSANRERRSSPGACHRPGHRAGGDRAAGPCRRCGCDCQGRRVVGSGGRCGQRGGGDWVLLEPIYLSQLNFFPPFRWPYLPVMLALAGLTLGTRGSLFPFPTMRELSSYPAQNK